MQVGLPDQFLDFRSPDEENDYKKDVYPGVIFWVSCLRIETIKRKKYLVIGEYRSLNRACIISNANTLDETKKWEKSEESSPVVVELKTGTVWQWILHQQQLGTVSAFHGLLAGFLPGIFKTCAGLFK